MGSQESTKGKSDFVPPHSWSKVTFHGPVFGIFSVGDSRSKNGPKLLKIVSRMLGVVGRITFGPKILGWVALAGP